MLGDKVAAQHASFRVVDAMEGPHRGRILRLKLESATPPRLSTLDGTEMIAISPRGRMCRFRIDSFAVFGGKARQTRFENTLRIDVRIRELDDTGPIGLRWRVRPAVGREISGR